MPVLLFLIDTSASMNQRSHLGTSYLDIAKGAVETFLKVNLYTSMLHIRTLLKNYLKIYVSIHFSQLRSRDPASRGDRYMLVSFEEAPAGIKVQTPLFISKPILFHSRHFNHSLRLFACQNTTSKFVVWKHSAQHEFVCLNMADILFSVAAESFVCVCVCVWGKRDGGLT